VVNQVFIREIPRGAGAAALLGLLTLALFGGCASAPPPEEEFPSAETYYQRGLEVLEGRRVMLFFSDVDYPRAIELFQEVIDNYPYAEYATLAELKIADVYFDRGQYDQAADEYQFFVERHPSHPEAAYAIYRNGLCAYERMRSADRDQTATREAIAQFQVLIDRYPDSQYTEDARRRMSDAADMLVRHDIEIGDFYLERGECHSAARRYRSALSGYPAHSERLRTMYRLAGALQCMRRTDEAIGLYRDILVQEPDGGLLGDVRDRLEELGLPVQTGNGSGE